MRAEALNSVRGGPYMHADGTDMVAMLVSVLVTAAGRKSELTVPDECVSDACDV